MSEDFRDFDAPDDLPEVEVEKKRGISIVWLIPIVAAIIGASLAYRTLTEKGPTISIAFRDGGGLEAGKTKIKYKAVDIGVVDTVDISEDLSHVRVTATLDKSAEPHLREGTQFWMVRPRVSATRITGLETLVSGVYIEVEPGPGKPISKFTGLDKPPIVRKDTPGVKYILEAASLGSLNDGSPIYFRDIPVGEVLGYEITDDRRAVNLHIFIQDPYHLLVRPNTRFWNRSGVNLSVTADGVQMQTDSLATLLAGGIGFETPGDAQAGEPPAEGTAFPLYSNYEDTAHRYTRTIDLIMYFDGSVRGLKVGAPVEFRGIKVGAVKDVRMEYNENTLDIRIPVLIQLEPERVKTIGNPASDPRRNVELLVQRGLRARLKTGSLLTGQLFIEMDLLPDTPLRRVGDNPEFPEIPTLPSTFDELTKTTAEIMADLKNLPLDELVHSMIVTVKSVQRLTDSVKIEDSLKSFDRSLIELNQSLAQTRKFIGNLDSQVVGPLASTLERSQKTLMEVENLVSEDSPVRVDLAHTLEELSDAARSLRILADYLERHPEALIHGKAGPRK